MDYRTSIRHTLATLGYRTGWALTDIPDNYPDFKPGNEAMSPSEIMLHMADLMQGPNNHFKGKEYVPIEVEGFENRVKRFFIELEELDKTVANAEIDRDKLLKMFQGPMIDAMTHVGQLMVIHRLCGHPKKAKQYFLKDIQIGKFKYDYND